MNTCISSLGTRLACHTHTCTWTCTHSPNPPTHSPTHHSPPPHTTHTQLIHLISPNTCTLVSSCISFITYYALTHIKWLTEIHIVWERDSITVTSRLPQVSRTPKPWTCTYLYSHAVLPTVVCHRFSWIWSTQCTERVSPERGQTNY